MLYRFVLWSAVFVMAALGGDVTVLSGSTFDDFITKNPVALVKFMAPWCGHCKRLAPEYEQAATELKKVNIPLAEVDATVDQELAQKYNVQGFPTMFLFRDGKNEPYNGGRTASTIVDWVKKMTGPALTWVEGEETGISSETDAGIRFVGAFKSKESEEAKLFEEAAKTHRMKGSFAAFVSQDENKTNKVTVLRPAEDPVSTTVTTKGLLNAFIGEESVPLFGVVNGENYGEYAARSKSWVWFAGNKDDFNKVAPEVRKVSKDYRSSFNFVWLDTDVHKQHAEHMLGLTEIPGLAIIYEEAKFHHPDPANLNQKEISKFIEKVKSGKVKRFLKSEPIPETNDGPVKVVVGQQFSEIVLQKDTDVFLEIYAPWCGHCKKLAPAYEEFANKIKANKHVMVAKFDGTANEPDVSGFEYKGFPTLFYVKAGSKEPIIYDGERTVEGLIAFTKKNASKPVVVSEDDSTSASGSQSDEL
ncbi:disulfide isomerase [Gregarina niphandrodes]|uniref:Protein disulfide-isomerase n=1 Tax=Gregarina niphandrodes TaxID=110365 RepID=A0A023B1Z1_GRENI|nr:disulfide isomerase [Gregarina niphandrodes]EZG49484.1 disulfide isomerase [Gregarina niphandrodes]|eukprot:XP_011132043.1 disulfide isomerase [Gregarina niphandrodes]